MGGRRSGNAFSSFHVHERIPIYRFGPADRRDIPGHGIRKGRRGAAIGLRVIRPVLYFESEEIYIQKR